MSVCCNSVAYINRGKGRSFMRVCWGFSSTKQYSMCTKCIKKNPELVKEALTFVGHADYRWEQGELVPVGWQHPRPVGWFVANSWSGQLPPHTMQVNSWWAQKREFVLPRPRVLMPHSVSVPTCPGSWLSFPSDCTSVKKAVGQSLWSVFANFLCDYLSRDKSVQNCPLSG